MNKNVPAKKMYHLWTGPWTVQQVVIPGLSLKVKMQDASAQDTRVGGSRDQHEKSSCAAAKTCTAFIPRRVFAVSMGAGLGLAAVIPSEYTVVNSDG